MKSFSMTSMCAESSDSMNGLPFAQLEIHFRRASLDTSCRRGCVIACTSSVAMNFSAAAVRINGAHCLMLEAIAPIRRSVR